MLSFETAKNKWWLPNQTNELRNRGEGQVGVEVGVGVGVGVWKVLVGGTANHIPRTTTTAAEAAAAGPATGETGPNERYEIILAVCPLSRSEVWLWLWVWAIVLPGCLEACSARGQQARKREVEWGPSMLAAAGRQHSQRGRREPTQAGRQAGRYQAAKLNACFVCKAIGQLLDFDWNLKTRKCENVEIVKMLRCENKRQLTSDRLRT